MTGLRGRFQELYARWKRDGTPVDALEYSIETPVEVDGRGDV